MKKKIVIVLAIACSSLLIFGCGNNTDKNTTKNSTEVQEDNTSTDTNHTANDATAKNNTTVEQTDITVEQAKKAALDHAGVIEADATFERVELEHEGNATCYDIEFTVGTQEYDYKVDVKTGNVTSYEHDLNDDGVNSTSPINE